MLAWDQYGSHKQLAGTRYTEVVFFHLVGSASQLVHSGPCGE
jgi:hypothetical protein